MLAKVHNYLAFQLTMLACKKIWDAFERIKTFYYPEISSKKKSIECLINNISLNQDFNNLFDSEFRTLTEIGNKFRIRHHEKGKINIGDDSYYEYFYNRCLSLLILVIHKLDKECLKFQRQTEIVFLRLLFWIGEYNTTHS